MSGSAGNGSGSLFTVEGLPSNRTPISLIGVPQATLQAWLAGAQTALYQLQAGAKVVSVSYSQGDGTRSVEYNRNSIGNLTMFIAQLLQALGQPGTRRRPMRPVF